MKLSHKEQLGKLNRVSGQVEAVKRMIDEERYCVEIMTQLKAARSALKAIEMAVLEKHMNSCLSSACCEDNIRRDQKIKEIMTLLKKYE